MTNSIMEVVEFCSYWNKYTLDMDLASLHAMLLPKLSSMDLENALPIITVFYIALFLIKEFTSQQKNCIGGPIHMEFTSLTMFSTILK